MEPERLDEFTNKLKETKKAIIEGKPKPSHLKILKPSDQSLPSFVLFTKNIFSEAVFFNDCTSNGQNQSSYAFYIAFKEKEISF